MGSWCDILLWFYYLRLPEMTSFYYLVVVIIIIILSYQAMIGYSALTWRLCI